jgi:hypothetical protein
MIEDFEIVDLGAAPRDGVELGHSFRYSSDAIGIGKTPSEAATDLIEQLGNEGFDTVLISNRLKEEGWFDEITPASEIYVPDDGEPSVDDDDIEYHVAVRFNTDGDDEDDEDAD